MIETRHKQRGATMTDEEIKNLEAEMDKAFAESAERMARSDRMPKGPTAEQLFDRLCVAREKKAEKRWG